MKSPGELAELMNLVKACAEHGSAFPNINTMAMLELQDAEREAREVVPKRKEALRQRDAKEQAQRERGAMNERPGPTAAPEPPQTQVRPSQEPILQRPNPATSIPNEGPAHAAPRPQTEDAAGYGRSTENTRDVALGERRYGEPHPVAPEPVTRPVVPPADRRE